jgi:hypothetical protein
MLPSTIKGVLACLRLSWTTVLPLSVANKPWFMTMKLNAPAMMTKAMRIIAASRPTIPRFCFASFIKAFFQFIFFSSFERCIISANSYIKTYETMNNIQNPYSN